jgi:hypothetical protein
MKMVSTLYPCVCYNVLCHSNLSHSLFIVDEFIHRTGFGNAVALLKIKGLV